MVPESGCSNPARTFMSVLLPAPFSPMSACTSPFSRRRLTPSSARLGPKRLLMLERERMVIVLTSSLKGCQKIAGGPADHRNRTLNDAHPEGVREDSFGSLASDTLSGCSHFVVWYRWSLLRFDHRLLSGSLSRLLCYCDHGFGFLSQR